MSVLKTKVQCMTEEGKKCSILVDAMSLKANLFNDIKEDKIIGFHDIDYNNRIRYNNRIS